MKVSTEQQNDLETLNRSVQRVWNQNAQFWSDTVGEGNDFQRLLIGPATELLLDIRPGEVVLDIACGNGHFARRMAQLGAHVVATDFSERFLETAKARTVENVDRLEYCLVDATDESQLLSLGEGRFDAAVCTMGVMDMAAIEPLARALTRLLKAEGRFVFSVMHPCFNTSDVALVAEEVDLMGTVVHSVKVMRYLGMKPSRGLGIRGQPEPHYYFHRTLTTLLSAFFRAGMVMDGIEEPAYPEGFEGARVLTWESFHEIPPVVVVRMRPGFSAQED
jgi:2-polyprenyl-3-methyl-5-hydroxy-6-metoxy-1,4-benzoquinol methylase